MRHGKPKSVCHNAPLVKDVVGEWTEWRCKVCGQNLDEHGQEYHYSVVGVTRKQVNRPSSTTNEEN